MPAVKRSFLNRYHPRLEWSGPCHSENQSEPSYRHVFQCSDQAAGQRHSLLETKKEKKVSRDFKSITVINVEQNRFADVY